MSELNRDTTSPACPPVTELVIGVQFAPIPDFTSGHFGWYWRHSLQNSWPKTQEAPVLADQFERFGSQLWNVPNPPSFVLSGPGPDRLQFINESDDRVIQIQNNKFIYNWRKREAAYPSFDSLLPEFISELGKFAEFLKISGLETMLFNQWEVTYINQIPKGTLWESIEDWDKIFPGIVATSTSLDRLKPESLSGDFRYVITPQQGRVHISMQHAKDLERKAELLMITLTARGPVESSSDTAGLESALTLGHSVLISAFRGVSSSVALAYWGI